MTELKNTNKSWLRGWGGRRIDMQNWVIDKNKELIKKHGKCKSCGSEKRLTIDHIIPQRTLRAAGIFKSFWNKSYNLQVFCYQCNLQKHHYVNLNLKTVCLMNFYLLISILQPILIKIRSIKYFLTNQP